MFWNEEFIDRNFFNRYLGDLPATQDASGLNEAYCIFEIPDRQNVRILVVTVTGRESIPMYTRIETSPWEVILRQESAIKLPLQLILAEVVIDWPEYARIV